MRIRGHRVATMTSVPVVAGIPIKIREIGGKPDTDRTGTNNIIKRFHPSDYKTRKFPECFCRVDIASPGFMDE